MEGYNTITNPMSRVTCGQTGVNVYFDYTEAANAIVASKVLFTGSDKVRFAWLFSLSLLNSSNSI